MDIVKVKFLNIDRKIAIPKSCQEIYTISRAICDCCEIPVHSRLHIYDNHGVLISLRVFSLSHINEISVQLDNHDEMVTIPNELTSLLSPPAHTSSKAKANNQISFLFGNNEKRDTNNEEEQSAVLNTPIESQSEFRGREFQNQITKFNRILAHLVNERTVLAWLRTNLAFITLAFKYMKLAHKYEISNEMPLVGEHEAIPPLLFFCGGLFMILLPWSWYRGFERFRVCKNMLDYDITRLGAYLHQMGFNYDNMSLGFLIVTSFVVIVTSSTVVIWTASD